MAVKLLKWGNGVGLLIPAFAARSCGFRPGTYVQILVLENEIRVRTLSAPMVAPAAGDIESFEEHREAEVRRLLEKW